MHIVLIKILHILFKVNSCYSTFVDILYEAPQDSILGSPFFKIYIFQFFCDTGYLDTANHSDDSTPYTCSSKLSTNLEKLQKGTEYIFKQFKNNHLKSNHLITTSEAEMEVACNSIHIIFQIGHFTAEIQNIDQITSDKRAFQ